MTTATLPADASATEQIRRQLITTATAETPRGQRLRVLCAELDAIHDERSHLPAYGARRRWDDLAQRERATWIDLRAALEVPTDDRDR